MASSLTTIDVKDGNGDLLSGGVQALDVTGDGSGPWSMAHILVDGASGTNRMGVTSGGKATVVADIATGQTIAAVTAITNTVTVQGTATVSGSVGVSGTVTVAEHNVTNSGIFVTQPEGAVAHDSDGTGIKPVLGGGYASAAAPASVSADGDVTRAWYLRNGAQATVLTAAGALIGGDATNGLDVDVTRVIPGTTATALGKAIDTVAGATDTGVGALFVRDDALATLTPAESDWVSGRTNARGAVWIAIEDGSGNQVTSFSGPTQYTEDAASAADPVGSMLMARRRDTLVTNEVTATGDNIALNASSKGQLHVRADIGDGTNTPYIVPASIAPPDDQAALLVTISPNGQNANGQALKVNGTPVTLSSEQVRAEDTGFTDGDDLFPIGAVRIDTPVANAGVSADADYSKIIVDNFGKLWVTGSYTEDAAASANPTFAMIGGVRRDSLSDSEVSAEDDNIAAKFTKRGELHTRNTALEAFFPGFVAHDAAAAAVGPTLIGGYASATAPSDVSATNDAVRAWFLLNGAQAVSVQSGSSIVADDAAFTPATTSVTMAGFTFDDSSPDSVNEGDAGAGRMSANRNVYVQIRDAAGNERGLNVDSSGGIAFAAQGYSASATFTPAAASHVANDCNGAAAEIDFNAPSGGRVMITSATLEIDGATAEATAWRVYLYNVTPPSAIADDGPLTFDSGDRASFLGYIDLGTAIDYGNTQWVENHGINKQVKLAGDSVFAYLVNLTTLTPANVAHIVTLHAVVI